MMIWSLQILRFIAAVMVVYVHAAQTAFDVTGSVGLAPYKIAGLGLAGVDIFFVISGVVIAKTAPGLTPQQFAWRRIRRIVPLCFVCAMPAVLVAATVGFGWRELVATFLLWPATDVMTAPLLGVAWTLSFEMLFYASATLVLFNRFWVVPLLGVYIVSFFLRSFGPIFQFLGNPIIVEFLFGVAITRAPKLGLVIPAITGGIVLLLAAGILGVAPSGGTLDFLRGDDNLRRVFACGIPAAIVVYGTMQIQTTPSVWTYLGEASYALYLVHTFMVTPLQVLWSQFPIPADAIIAIGLIASLLFAWRVHELVEKPILNKFARRSATKGMAEIKSNVSYQNSC
jgi:exopolysaccharide production protein ExoZ